MKKVRPLSKYYKDLSKKINKRLIKSAAKYDEEDYHKLRVSIKKLRALLLVAEFCNKDFKSKKYLKQAEKVYNQSGVIREFQLEQSFLKKNKHYFVHHYLADLEQKIKKEKQKFAALLNTDLKRKLKKSLKEIYFFIKNISEEEVKTFMIKQSEELNNLTQQKFLNTKQVHELRKKIKVDFYARKALNLKGLNNFDAENNFQELLGQWHDCRTMSNHLEKNIVKEMIDQKELKQLLEIDKEILYESENLFVQINTSIKTLTFN